VQWEAVGSWRFAVGKTLKVGLRRLDDLSGAPLDDVLEAVKLLKRV